MIIPHFPPIQTNIYFQKFAWPIRNLSHRELLKWSAVDYIATGLSDNHSDGPWERKTPPSRPPLRDPSAPCFFYKPHPLNTFREFSRA